MLCFKGFLALPRETQASLVLLREDTPLAFPREQTHLFFNTSFVDGDSDQLNTLIYFDTDSIFFVCNN